MKCWSEIAADKEFRGQAFGIALKLTIAGNNQLTHASTYLFGLTVLGCILVQMVSIKAAILLIWLEIDRQERRTELLQQGLGYLLHQCVSLG